jgi:hypothetical protein
MIIIEDYLAQEDPITENISAVSENIEGGEKEADVSVPKGTGGCSYECVNYMNIH